MDMEFVAFVSTIYKFLTNSGFRESTVTFLKKVGRKKITLNIGTTYSRIFGSQSFSLQDSFEPWIPK